MAPLTWAELLQYPLASTIPGAPDNVPAVSTSTVEYVALTSVYVGAVKA
jgi:hypothetical protein